jgi:ABC-type uncharacterized transport system substrate-binding protein
LEEENAMHRIKKISLIYLPILLVLFCLFSEGAHAQQAPPKKNVLVLHGLWRIRTWEISLNSSLHNEFLADKAVTAGITHVYLGLEDFPDSVYPQKLIEQLRYRIEKNPVDLVISVLPGADRFLLSYKGKKIAYVASYHEGMSWNDGIFRGIKEVVAGTGIELKSMFMDTKRNQSEEFKKAAALKAKKMIDEFSPDVVITSDDIAAKYLIVPYYKNAAIPFVFCGVNWDVSAYGFPYTNVTGMVEVDRIEPLIAQLQKHAKGDRLGRLAMSSLSQEKIIEYHKKLFGMSYDKIYLVKTMDEWKKRFNQLQEEVDMLIIGNPQGITDWDEADFTAFSLQYTKIPTGTTAAWRMPYSLIGYARIPEEQGRWSAQTAIEIIDGTKPIDIPLVKNREGKLMINVRLVKKLGIVLDKAIYQHADIIK